MFAFRFQSFRFQGNYPSFYVHCEAFVCESQEKTADCDQSCNNRRRKKMDVNFTERHSFYMEEGPVVFVEAGQKHADNQNDNSLAEEQPAAKDPASEGIACY
jgi:hypothetical protein